MLVFAPRKKKRGRGKESLSKRVKQDKGLEIEEDALPCFGSETPCSLYVCLSSSHADKKSSNPSEHSAWQKKERIKNTYFWWLLQRPLLAPLKSYQRVEVPLSVKEHSGGVGKRRGSHPLLPLPLLVPSSSSFLGSDGILSKQDQGEAAILGQSQRPGGRRNS